MSHTFTGQQVIDLEAVLSPPRFGTYLREVGGDRHKAMALYCWNTDISAAFYIMLQFCELSIRNGAVEAVEAEFGPNWHLNRGFGYTLPVLRGGRGYQPRDDLQSCARRLPTSGKVVAELKFAFWQHLFVKGQQARIWDAHLASAYPGYNKSLSLSDARTRMFKNIEVIRKLRNRIAHHEPIFSRNLAEDRDRIREVIQWRRPGTAQWVDTIEKVTDLLASRP
ncbi:Abi family protein [Tritonibacter mobilis]|uniref:Abi family protein n=1 Tax=Tritonibacter mobilis TaxID=379347 RepID=UPI000DA1B929|nr:Abi family protein [Tritonibacter mobilis]